jgi:heme-degrading monooxygenase HmoA
MFIAMNQFQVDPARAAEFEEVWRTRESHLHENPGFVQFALLRGDDAGDYISHSTWESREAFLAWTQSQSFRSAHSGKMPEGVIVGHPRARFYEAVLTRPARPPGRDRREPARPGAREASPMIRISTMSRASSRISTTWRSGRSASSTGR